MRKTKRRSIFKYVYLVYIAILAVLVTAALLYVNSVLELYENEHPQRHLEKATELLIKEAESGELWQKDGVPSMANSVFEPGVDQKKEFVNKLKGEIKYSPQKWLDDSLCSYNVIHEDTAIAEIRLRKSGDMVQKLVIIGIQPYEIVSYVPLSHSYTLELPADVLVNSDINITVNGIQVLSEHGSKDESGKTTFTFDNLYKLPDVKISDNNGSFAKVKMPDGVNGKIEFDNCFYTLTLPSTLSVSINGEKQMGLTQEDGRVNYRIRLVSKADVAISDLFGNTVSYKGESTVPLTYYEFTTGGGCTLKVDGKDIPESCITTTDNPDFKNFADLATGLPSITQYKIVVLKDKAEVTLTDKAGNPIQFDSESKIQDLTPVTLGTKLDQVPAEVSNEINVLKVLEDWSLFMSCDLNFNGLSKHLIKNSYQYNVAWKYNTSIDRTFTSNHGLGNPPFEEESVTNFTWISDNCFSVDIRFVKHMIVLGKRLNDEMNEKCYFVKYDDTNDRKDNPKWKLVAMKEIVKDAE